LAVAAKTVWRCVPPTGKKIDVEAMNFYRLSGGQFVEEHGQPDLLGLFQQIGAVPARRYPSRPCLGQLWKISRSCGHPRQRRSQV
jgi:hypothetical protein